MSLNLKNKVALVTGGNRGIGRAIVESFLKHGANKVYLAVRNPESTKPLEQKYGDRVVTLPADVTDGESIKQLAKTATDVDVVVNNAGVLKTTGSLDSDALESLQTEIDANVYGLIRIANAFADTLVKQKGALVQLNSVASIKNFPQVSTYSASKAASYSITQGLRWDFMEKGVSVVSVHPGPILTDMAASAGFTEGGTPESVAEATVAALEAGSFHVFPDEVAKQFETAYQSFADNCVLADFSE